MAAAMAAAFSFGMDAIGSRSAKKKAKRERRRQERIERLMTAEELRRLGIEQEQVLGSAKAQIAASGFTGYGASTQSYLSDLQAEQGKQRQFTETVGASRVAAIRNEGQARESAYSSQSISSGIQGLGSVGEAFNWGIDG